MFSSTDYFIYFPIFIIENPCAESLNARPHGKDAVGHFYSLHRFRQKTIRPRTRSILFLLCYNSKLILDLHTYIPQDNILSYSTTIVLINYACMAIMQYIKLVFKFTNTMEISRAIPISHRAYVNPHYIIYNKHLNCKILSRCQYESQWCLLSYNLNPLNKRVVQYLFFQAASTHCLLAVWPWSSLPLVLYFCHI